ncbi:O-antigen ligase family protein [Sinorhizobium fredii]|uniref:O-antigen ligase family protein n=1 Tax=Rhizobium fredii TaxID=380 RepID=UPI00210CB0E8|nr:O-antigen ligase family protein [Sinorhizobium fredii]
MQISFVGLLVCAGILLVGYLCRGPLIIGLIASLPFGATAFMTLSSLGGSSPLIYTFFAVLLVTAVAMRRRIWRDLGDVFGKIRPLWVLCSLMLYAIVGAWLFPRLFAGQISVFVQSPTRRGIVEAALAPVSGNITQTGYFVLGGLTAIALCVLLLQEDRIESIRRGFLLWCGLHAGMGLLDLLGKLAGAGDILSPVRTASYAMLTEVTQGGYWRIAGANSEASAFGGGALTCLAFCYTYWRKTKSRLAQGLASLLLVLLVLSTSSTAYVGLAILSIPIALSIFRSFLAGRIDKDEILIIALIALAAATALSIVLYKEEFFAPFVHLIDSMVLSKSSSASGQERLYWNIKSLQAFINTSGLGVGLGSSRASSWPIAIASQLGLVGGIMMLTLLFVVFRGMGSLKQHVDRETNAVVSSVRACALASVVSSSLIGASADPGMFFFIALAVISTTRANARRNRRAAAKRVLQFGQPAPSLLSEVAGRSCAEHAGANGMLDAARAKARRGELRISVPVGYIAISGIARLVGPAS